MNDISKIEEKILSLKKKKEKLQTQKAILLSKEAQDILGNRFSHELVLSILFYAWKTSSDQQKEEWMKSSETFRKISKKRKSKRIQTSQRETPQNTEENS